MPITHIQKVSPIHSNNSADNDTRPTLQFGVIFVCLTKLQQRRRVLLQHLDITGRLNHQQNQDAGVVVSNWLLRLWVSATIRTSFRSQLMQLGISHIFNLWHLKIYLQNLYLQQGFPHMVIKKKKNNLLCFLRSESFHLHLFIIHKRPEYWLESTSQQIFP